MPDITYGGRDYWIVECGSDGDCLFSSLRYVLAKAGVIGIGAISIPQMRAACAEGLTAIREEEWFSDFHYDPPDDEFIVAIRTDEWGDATCILALLWQLYPHVRVGVVTAPETGTAIDLTVVDANTVTHTVYVYWNGINHFQAMELAGDDASDAEDGEIVPEETTSTKVTTKLSIGTVSSGITTLKKKKAATLEIHVLDVGQGESTVILLHDNDEIRCVVIDGGRATRGGGTLRRHLQQLKVSTIDHMICTHYDYDHVEGLTHLLDTGKFKVANVWTPGGLFVDDDPEKGRLLTLPNKYIAFAKAVGKAKTMDEGDQIVIGELTITCVSSHAESGFDVNNMSVAVRLDFHRFRYYTGGDLEDPVETSIVGSVVEGKKHICAMKCGHHGSRSSSSRWFLSNARPTAAVISCGKQNKFSHPDDDLIARLCGTRSLQWFYLTNCFYNRAGVNPDYNTRFAQEQEEWKKAKESANDDSETTSPKKKKGKEKVSAPKQNRALRGTVAGDKDHLGSIVIRVPEARAKAKKGHGFDVGYFDASKKAWVWRSHTCGDKVADGESSDGRESLVDVSGLPAHDDGWLDMVQKLRGIKPFSLLTKAPTKKQEKAKLPQEDIDEIERDLTSDESSDDEFRPGNEEERMIKRRRLTRSDSKPQSVLIDHTDEYGEGLDEDEGYDEDEEEEEDEEDEEEN